MFHARTLNKLTVPVLNLFLERHSSVRKRMKKKQKIQVITAWLANSEVSLDQNRDIDRTNGEDDGGADNNEELDSSDTDEKALTLPRLLLNAYYIINVLVCFLLQVTNHTVYETYMRWIKDM